MAGNHWRVYIIVLLVAAAVYAGCAVSPPSLMDDVDAVQAQIARNMLTSGDWVTARLDGVVYLEKAPLIYWLIARSFKVFGASDVVARIPVVLSAIALAWLTTAFAMWAFGRSAALYAGLCISTCFGLFLFTRILVPDVMLTTSIALTMWAFLRAIDETEQRPRLWALVMAASLGTSLLFKSLIGVVFPVAAALIYLVVTRQLFDARVRKALRLWSGLLVALLIAAPWHILATLRNPPYFEFTMRSAAGEYHGFLWFYFINRINYCVLLLEHVLSGAITIPFRASISGCFICSGCFRGVCTFRLSRSSAFNQPTARGRRACWLSAGPALSWCSLRFQRLRNITRCRVIRRSRCCWVRLWRQEATGYGMARAFCAESFSRQRRPSLP